MQLLQILIQNEILTFAIIPGIVGDFWTSGTRSGMDKEFFWMETGKNLSFTHWNDGEPNEHEYFKEPEECIQLRFSGGMKWNDVACEYDYNVICEK